MYKRIDTRLKKSLVITGRRYIGVFVILGFVVAGLFVVKGFAVPRCSVLQDLVI